MRSERDRIFEVIKTQVRQVLPEVPADAIIIEASLRDLGANSLDRVEVAMCAMEALGMNIPRTQFAKVENLGMLVELFYANRNGK